MDFNDFYPESAAMQSDGMWQLQLVIKMQDHLRKANNGDREAESKLANRIGQIRRNVRDFNALAEPLRDVIEESVAHLRSVGRTVNLGSSDPAVWITQRDGSPRW